MIKNFEQLDVWKRSCQLAVATYEIFEKVKDYGLCNQVTRAAVSVPSNIAEGSERHLFNFFTLPKALSLSSVPRFILQES